MATKKPDKIIDPIDASFDDVAKAVIQPAEGTQQATTKVNKNKDLAVKNTSQQAASKRRLSL